MFFDALQRFGDQPALITPDLQLSYRQLQRQILPWRHAVTGQRQLVFACLENNVDDICFYLAMLQSRHPVLLLDGAIDDDKLAALIAGYQPNWLYRRGVVTAQSQHQHMLDERLALLLSTSGSTGSAKQVALSYTNVQSNAQAICQSLPIKPSDVALTTLPPHYTYGLSVIHSHLEAGAALHLFNGSVNSRAFWDTLKSGRIASFAAVPFQYEWLDKLRFTRQRWPGLRYMTQAGGKLAASMVTKFADYAEQQQIQFLPMYGQTEATARIAVNHNASDKPDSIGQAIAGGECWISDDGQLTKRADVQGELVYRGDNVFLGYAQAAENLASFETNDILYSGDVAYFDQQGDIFICGRIKRFIKPFGHRINLDEVEQLLMKQSIKSYATGNDKQLQVAVLNNDISAVQTLLCGTLGLPPAAVSVRCVERPPLTANHKVDYPALQEQFDER